MPERNSWPSYRGRPSAAGIVMIVVAKDVDPVASELVVTDKSSWREDAQQAIWPNLHCGDVGIDVSSQYNKPPF